MTAVASVRVFAAAVMCCAVTSLPALAQGVGAIGGTITDSSGAVLPGVTVTLASPEGGITANRTAVTDERGAFQFTRLVPRRYSVKAELQGFQSMIQEDVDVNADRSSRVDMSLTIGDVAESITVRGEAPLLDTTSALSQAVMSREVLDTLPTANDIWSIARLAPAVQSTKYDVGGREMFAQSNSIVHGSTRKEQSYLWDGMDLNNTVDGSQIHFYVDTFSAQEINYITGQAPAEHARGGVLINTISRTGTNAYRGGVQLAGLVQEFDNVSDTMAQQLLSGVPAQALAANPNIAPSGKTPRLWETGFTYGGPIIRDRVWFQGAGKMGEVYRYRIGSYNADGTQLLEDNRMLNTMGKISWAVTPNSQVHFTHAWVEKGRYHVSGGPTVTEFFDERATVYNASRNHLFLPKWTHVLSSRMVLDVGVASQKVQNNREPQPEVQPGDIPRFDSVTRTNTVALGNYNNIAEGWRTQFAASLSFIAGNHELKVGHQYINSVLNSYNISHSHFPSGLRAVYRNGVPDSVNTYNTPTGSDRHYREHALFIQDAWRPTRKLVLNVGLRYEDEYEWINDGESPLCQEQTIFIAERCFGPVSGVPDLSGFAPRFSAIYDLFGNGRTALKFTANRYLITQMGLSGNVNPIRLASDTRPWNDINGDRIPQLNELGASTGFSLGTSNRIDPDLKWPYTNELVAEVQQELPGAMVLSTGYYFRGHRDQIGQTNVAVPRDSYIPLTVTEVASGRQVTVYNQAPSLRGRFDVLFSNHDELDASFHGFDLTLQRRMRDGWMLMGSLSLGKSEADIYGEFIGSDLNNPNFAFRRGPRSEDVPVAFKMSGAYELPYGFRVAANGQYFRGWPETTTVRVSSNTVALTQVNQVLTVEPRGTTRLPGVTLVDLNLAKTWRRGSLSFEPRIDVFNLLNASAVTLRITELGPAYGRAGEILGARLIRAGANITW
jgi:hypothetical protein